MIVEKNNYYIYQTDHYEAVVEVVSFKKHLDGNGYSKREVRARPIKVFNNITGWHEGILTLSTQNFRKEITKEENPEYFL